MILGLPGFTHAVAETMSEVAIRYPDSPLNGPHVHSGLRSGERVPPIDGQAQVGSGTAPKFALFAEKTAAVTAFVQEFGKLIDADLRSPLHDGAISVVRPDGYLACSARDTSVIAAYLRSIVQQPAVKENAHEPV